MATASHLPFQGGYAQALNHGDEDVEANEFGFGPIVELAKGRSC